MQSAAADRAHQNPVRDLIYVVQTVRSLRPNPSGFEPIRMSATANISFELNSAHGFIRGNNVSKSRNRFNGFCTMNLRNS
jgi:hypothetical protein